MMPRTPLTLLLLLSLTALPGLQAQRAKTPQSPTTVVSTEERIKTLTEAESHFSRQPLDIADLTEKPHPFSFASRAQPVEKPTTTQAPPIAVSDLDILRAVASNLKPKGTFVRAEKSILMLQRGSIEEGQAIPFEFRGTSYKVVVERIDTRYYTLRLNDEVLTVPLTENAGDRIQINR